MNIEQWRRQVRPMDFRGHRVCVYEGGQADGDPLLLIHGFPTAAWDWHRIWERLGRRHRLIAPDLIGFGFSDKPPDFGYSVSAQADLCEQALNERSVRRYHVLAHDYGNSVAQEILARRIDSGPAHGISSVCFLNGGLFPERHRPRPIQRALSGRLGPILVKLVDRKRALKSLVSVFGPDTRPDEDAQEAFWELMSRNNGLRIVPRLLGYISERARNRSRWVSALIESPVPLMFVDGELDPVSGVHMADRWEELLPTAPLVRLPRIGHYPQIEAPQAVLDACLPFFRSAGDHGPKNGSPASSSRASV